MAEVSDELYGAMSARDPRFDGRYYVGIVSTGIVCFPSCRSRLPRRENVRVYASLADALRAGFRPCKRCRPDSPRRQSPDAEMANRALDILRRRLPEPVTLASLAQELNMSPYHLQRTFKRIVGVSPARQLGRLRMERAGQLLAAGGRTVGEVAREVGFRSASHFAAAFRNEWGIAPSEYQKCRGG